MEENNSKTNIEIDLKYLLMIIGVVLIIVGSIMLILTPSKKNKSSQNKEIEEDNRVYIPEDEIITLMGYLPSVKKESATIKKYQVYQDKKVTIDDVDKSLLIENAIKHSSRVKGCTDAEISANEVCDFAIRVRDINSNLKIQYGIEDMELVNRIYGDGNLKCTLSTDRYGCSYPEDEMVYNALDAYFDIYNDYYTKYLKAEKDENNIYIYEAYVNYRFDDINTQIDSIKKYNFKLYKNSNTDELLIEELQLANDYYDQDSNNEPFKDKIFNKLGKNYTTYKHTFKINGENSFSWVSTEPIE